MEVPSFMFGTIRKYATNNKDKEGRAYPENLDFARDLDYHVNWKSLMPVVVKLKRITNSDEFLNGYDDISETELGMALESRMDKTFACELVTIERTYKAVVKFVEWYLKNKTK